MSDAMLNLVPLFVYGSLRPGSNGATKSLMRGAVTGPHKAYMPGRLFFHECRAYPVVTTEPTNLVRGDLVTMLPESPDFHWLVRMEEDAGYVLTLATIIAQQSDGSWGRTEAWVFEWPHGTDGLEEVTNGDWLTVDGAEWPEGAH